VTSNDSQIQNRVEVKTPSLSSEAGFTCIVIVLCIWRFQTTPGLKRELTLHTTSGVACGLLCDCVYGGTV
jgi:hypothetical protein